MKTRRLFKVLVLSLPMVSIGSLCATSCSASKTFTLAIEASKDVNLEFTNLEGEVGQNFWTYITSDRELYDVSVTIDGKDLPEEAIFFAPTNEQFKYYLKIYGNYITSNKISVKIADKPVIETLTITFDAGEGVIQGTSEKQTTLEVENGAVWSTIQNKPLAYLEDMNFDGWSLDKQNPIPDDHLFNGDETVFALYSNCEHEFDSYSVSETHNPDDGTTIRRIYGHCEKCGKSIELNDEQLKKLEGYVLVKENDKYRLSDSLPYEIQYAASTSVDIYLIYGTYYVYGTRVGSVVQAKLHGVHDSGGKMVSTLDCYYEESIGTEKIWSIIGAELYCDNMILAGKTDADLTWQGGIQCNHLWCEYCLVTGAQAAYCDTCTFLNCNFDSTNVINESKTNTDYSVFLYNRYATFHDCNFKSIGKAIKIYSHGAKANNSYEFLRCKFTITERVNPKACINVDSSHQPATGKYQVYVYGCEQLSGYESTEPLYADEGGYTDFYNYPRPTNKD